MDDGFPVGLVRPLLHPIKMKQWQANLALDFWHENGRTFLAKRKHEGPLVIQKTLYPEGQAVCHGVIVHPPGGVASGDQLTLRVNVEDGANVLLTTPGAGKWYKSIGGQAHQTLNFDVKNNACLEWLPQENILFDASQVCWGTQVNLEKNAKYVGWEITCFGRQAQNEAWSNGAMHQNVAIKRDGQLVWQERANVEGKNRLLQSVVGLHGNAVNASFIIAAGETPMTVLNACREMTASMVLDLHAKKAVTALPEVFVARYVGQSSQHARLYFERLWQILRPWYLGQAVTRPRVWNT